MHYDPPVNQMPAAAGSELELGEAYRALYLIRRFEERTAELFAAGVITGTAHSCIGQEAIAVGTVSALAPGDYVVGHHRSHGHVIAKGGDVRRMMAELMGKASGYCRGLGGSMHIADIELGVLGCNGIVGAGLPIACGSALSAQIRGSGQVSVAFFGDGAVNQGLVHEALNLAAVWRLPIVFVCENNQVALSTEWRESRAVESIAARASAYGMPGITADGNDVVDMRRVAEGAIRHARGRRWPDPDRGGHLPPHPALGANEPRRAPRPEAAADWARRDPVLQVESALAERGVPAETLQATRASVDEELEGAIGWAETEPVLAEDDLAAFVYATSAREYPAPASSDRTLSFYGAVCEALGSRWRRRRASSSSARTSAGWAASSMPRTASGSSSAASACATRPSPRAGSSAWRSAPP